VTLGCRDACPLVPGKHYENGEFDSPMGKCIAEIRPIRDETGRRGNELLDRLEGPNVEEVLALGQGGGRSTLGRDQLGQNPVGVSAVLAYTAAGIIALWGVAHVLPTARVVEGYNDTSRDNRLVITQEWIAEAMTMWFIAAVVVTASILAGSQHSLVAWIYRVSAFMLLALAALTAVTGARTPVVFFKICPFLQGATAVLLLAASWT